MTAMAERDINRAGGYAFLQPTSRRRSAVSVQARAVRMTARDVLRWGERSIALFGKKSTAIAQIWDLVEESHEYDGADGEPRPISNRAAELAIVFVRALPDDIPIPEFAWEPDGAISLDWIPRRNHLVSVSIGESRRLPYAWLDGVEAGHAVAFFDEQTVPPRILDNVRRITRRDDAPIWPR